MMIIFTVFLKNRKRVTVFFLHGTTQITANENIHAIMLYIQVVFCFSLRLGFFFFLFFVFFFLLFFFFVCFFLSIINTLLRNTFLGYNNLWKRNS